MQKITPFLWFGTQAEEAARYYCAIFPDAAIGAITRYDAAAAAVSGMPQGSVLTVAFQLAGQQFVALNGGPQFRFNESISFLVSCDSQEEVDYYWETLGAGGDPAARQCGWLKDRYGLSWQIVPTELDRLLSDPDPDKAGRVMQAMLQMKKLDIAALRQAYHG